MGIFGSFFQGNKEGNSFSNEVWIPLTSVNELENALESSSEKTIVLFKHSTRCGVSSMVWNQVKNLATQKNEEVELYFLDLIAYRDVSNAIAEKLGVFHQSPQLIVVQYNEVVYHDSHSYIDTEKVVSFF